MDYSYEIVTLEPRHKFMSVRYYAEGKDDYFRNFNPEVFTDEALKEIIEKFFYIVKKHWEFQDSVDSSSLTLASGSTNTASFDEEAYLASIEAPRNDRILFSRLERNALLMETDHMMFSDTPDPSQAWLDYRQALRDVPQQDGFPDNIVWPIKPTE